MVSQVLFATSIEASTNLSGAVTDIDEDVVTWTPASFPSITGWWDANDLSGQGNGTNLTTWTDKTSNAFVMNQRASGQLPSKETVNGLIAVKFDQSNGECMDCTTVSQATLLGTTGLIAIVAQMTGNPDNTDAANNYKDNMIIGDDDIAGGNGANCFLSAYTASGVPKWRFTINPSSYRAATVTATISQPQVVLARFDTTQTIISVDGGSETTTSTPTGSPQRNTNTMSLGLVNGGSGTKINGYMFEIVTSTSNGSSGDRTNLISYLKTRWGIA